MKLRNNSANRGARGTATGSGSFANTKHLFRILTYLREVEEPKCKTHIGVACCMGLGHTNDALRFLINIGAIRKISVCQWEANSRGYRKDNTTLYELSNKWSAQEIIDSI